MDLVEPLPEWTKDDLKEVILHNNYMSPACCKIRAILTYNKVPFTTIKGKKKDSAYKKIPVLMLNGRQINDSFIIVKNLAPVLYGNPLTPEELDFEERMTYGLLPSMLSQTFDNGWETRKLVSKFSGKCGACCFTVCCCNCCCMRSKFSKNLLKKEKLESNNTDPYIAMIEARLSENAFLQGPEIGILDLSLYGVTQAFSIEPRIKVF